MKTYLYLFLTFGLIVSFTDLFSQSGGEAGAFLKNGFGIKETTLRGAVTASVSGPASVFWNPANLKPGKQSELMFAYVKPFGNFSGISTFQAGFFSTVWDQPFGLGIVSMNVDGIEEVNSFSGPTGTQFSSRQTAVLLGTSYPVTKKLNLGATVKWIHIGLAGENASGIGADFGLNWAFSEQLTFGINLRDLLGARLALGSKTDIVPFKMQTGFAWKTLDILELSTDVVLRPGQKTLVLNGLSVDLWNSALFAYSGFDAINGTGSLGFSVRWYDFSLESGYLIQKHLGNSFSFGGSIRF
ncbi:MAG: hypothetical protein J0L62_07470 [Bacteroidetes bacterium]|nr:hypothetical protein [Bacteroidota bacterium]